MKIYNKQKNKGFTLIETMIAVFILAITITGTLGIISTSLYSSRYANNEITANYLAQEVSDYIRNDRDTIAFQRMSDSSYGWTNFLNKYGFDTLGTCFSTAGCEIEPVSSQSILDPSNIYQCNTVNTWETGTIDCRILNYDENATEKVFYTYQTPLSGYIPSNFKRKVNMSINATSSPSSIGRTDELDIMVTVEWKNGNLVRSKILRTSLLNWQKP